MNEKSKKFKIAGLGEILWDLLPQGKQLGGAPANFAYHAQRLGAQGFAISAIGDDDACKQILAQLQAMQLSSGFIAVDKKHPTGMVTVEIDAGEKQTIPFIRILPGITFP